jgi:branched-subunit amino acid transport protein
VREGPIAALAIAVAGAVVLVTRKDLLAVLAGMVVAAAARAVGW